MKKTHSLGEMHLVICRSPPFWNQYEPIGSGTSVLPGRPLTATPEMTTPPIVRRVRVHRADESGWHADERAVWAACPIAVCGGGLELAVDAVRYPGRTISQFRHRHVYGRSVFEGRGVERGDREEREQWSDSACGYVECLPESNFHEAKSPEVKICYEVGSTNVDLQGAPVRVRTRVNAARQKNRGLNCWHGSARATVSKAALLFAFPAVRCVSIAATFPYCACSRISAVAAANTSGLDVRSGVQATCSAVLCAPHGIATG